MNVIPKTIVLVIVGTFLFASASIAQTGNLPMSVGIQAGTMVYQGDLVPGIAGSSKMLKPSLGIFVSKPLNNNFSIRAGLAKGELSANEALFDSPAFRKSRAFQFSTPVTELSAVMVFDFTDQSLDNTGRFSPYLFGGLGLSFLNIHRDWSWLDSAAFDSKSPVITGLAIDTLHKLPKLLPVIPIGVGVRYTIDQQWSVHAEMSYRYCFSDYLDGFSKSADPRANDSYYSLSVGLSYHFLNQGIKCPPARR